MKIVPIYQKEANDFVKKHHRHHKPVVGSIFQIACGYEYDACDVKKKIEIKVTDIVGVAICGRPVGKFLDDKRTIEVNRLCTDGTKNACSMLYAAAWRVAKNLGYTKIITYILVSEPGTSLYAAGWTLVGERGGLSWNVPSRPREDHAPNIQS